MTIPFGLLKFIQQDPNSAVRPGEVGVGSTPGLFQLLQQQDPNSAVREGGTPVPQTGLRGLPPERTQQQFLTDETLLALARSAADANKLETRSFKDQILDRVLGQSTPQRIDTEDARRSDLLKRLRALRERL